MSAKIALIATLPVALVMTFYSYHNYLNESEGISRSAENQLLRVAEGLKGPSNVLMKENNLSGLQEIVTDAARGADINLITFFDGEGNIISCNKKKWIGKTLLDMYDIDVTERDIALLRKALGGGYSLYYDPEDRQYCLTMHVNYAGEKTGAVLISMDTRNARRQIMNRTFESFGISIMSTILIGTIVYFLFHYVFASRIKSISEAANKLASGEMTVRAAVKGNDELGELAASFNAMAGGIKIWHNNLEEIIAGRVKELSALFNVVDIISRSLDLNKVLPNVLESVLKNLGAGKGAIVLVDADGRTLTLMAQRGMSEEGLCQIVEMGHGCIGDAILKNAAFRVGGVNEEEIATIPGLEEENVLSALVVPITACGTVIGAMGIYSETKDKFTDHDEALLSTIGSQVGVAVENARLYQRTLDLAQFDGLTGLANRRYLLERLGQELARADRYQTSLSALMLDLDKFKSFNDTYGHLKGDELLRSFSALLKGMVRASDIAGRYGGEEFCVMLPNTSIKGALVIAERIRKAAEELKVPIDDHQPPACRTVSIGVSEFSPGESIEKLLSRADAALYRAKESGRNRVVS
jgi:diguanylate cyclase (GGDEF)-like protein